MRCTHNKLVIEEGDNITKMCIVFKGTDFVMLSFEEMEQDCKHTMHRATCTIDTSGVLKVVGAGICDHFVAENDGACVFVVLSTCNYNKIARPYLERRVLELAA